LHGRSLNNHDISKLEEAVEKHRHAKSFLEMVLHELNYRKQKKRVLELKGKVEKLIVICETNTLGINLPAGWINHDILDQHIPVNIYEFSTITFQIPSKAKVMVAAAIKLLSLLNLLADKGVYTSLEFTGNNNKSISYLKRMSFFQSLLPAVNLTPKQLHEIQPSEYYGKNTRLVEIEKVNVGTSDDHLPNRLSQTIINNSAVIESFKQKLNTAVETLFSELTDNINEHSESTLTAFAICQIYNPQGKPVAQVSVCDSGTGILNTLRPALNKHYPDNPEYSSFPDNELALEMFKRGLSRRGTPKGCGLTSCARQALKFNASVHIRTNTSRIELVPSQGRAYTIKSSNEGSDLSYVQGTHITFEFPLYKPTNN